jgi:hypothetical protein
LPDFSDAAELAGFFDLPDFSDLPDISDAADPKREVSEVVECWLVERWELREVAEVAEVADVADASVSLRPLFTSEESARFKQGTSVSFFLYIRT